MARPFRQTSYDTARLIIGGVFALVGISLLGLFIAQARAKGALLAPEAELALLPVGWGGALEALLGVLRAPMLSRIGAAPLAASPWLLVGGGALWLAGWGVIASGIRHVPGDVPKLVGTRLNRRDKVVLVSAPLLLLLVAVATSLGLSGRALGTAIGPGMAAVLTLVAWALVLGVAATAGVAYVVAGRKDRADPKPEELDNPLGAPLHPALARYTDLHWGTLAAYGGGILLAEVALILAHTFMAAKLGVAPVIAFALSLLLGFVIAFVAGFLGAANARRLSVPEATLGLVYLGLPVPAFLTIRHFIPSLQLEVGYFLREITYVAELLGRPEGSYWLVFAGLVLMMVMGITSGFVATGSGRVDTRAGFELFVARRHVMVFRPGLLLGAFAVLVLGIIPPLIIIAIVRAAEAAVERTRIRALGLADPLKAAEALHAAKQSEQTPTSMMTALSVGGVGVGVMALIIVLSVMSGFEDDLQKKILGTNAHGVVLKYGADTFTEYAEVMKKIEGTRGLAGQTPFILNEVMISSEGDISGTIIKGIDPATVGTVTELRNNVTPPEAVDHLVRPENILKGRFGGTRGRGFFDDLPVNEGGGAALQGQDEPAELDRGGGAPADRRDELDDLIMGSPKPAEEKPSEQPVLPGIIVGKELAAQLHVVVGDRINVVSPLGGELGPHGPTPKSRPFRVAGIFYSGMYEYDSKFVYISLDAAKDFFGLKGVSGIEVKLHDIDDARKVMRDILNKLEGYPYKTRDWGEMNRNLFSALRLEKLVMGIILSIIVIVAAGLIVATVIMLVLEKRKEIAVLKALGVSDGGIVKIFLAEGLQIGVAGGVLGLLSGLAWCFFIEKVGIRLDPEVYYIPALPVRIEPLQTAIPVVIAVLVTYLASIYPALKASRVEPVEGLKAE